LIAEAAEEVAVKRYNRALTIRVDIKLPAAEVFPALAFLALEGPVAGGGVLVG